MNVLLAGRGKAHLDDEGDIRVIETASGDVGGHHHAALGFPEGVRRLSAMALALAAVNLRHGATQRDEKLGGELRGARGREEADDLVIGHRRLMRGDELHEEVQVVVEGRHREPLLHLEVGGRVLLADAVHVGVPGSQCVGGDGLHLLGHGGGEEERLAVAGMKERILSMEGLKPISSS